jgi:hypothetical protein
MKGTSIGSIDNRSAGGPNKHSSAMTALVTISLHGTHSLLDAEEEVARQNAPPLAYAFKLTRNLAICSGFSTLAGYSRPTQPFGFQLQQFVTGCHHRPTLFKAIGVLRKLLKTLKDRHLGFTDQL